MTSERYKLDDFGVRRWISISLRAASAPSVPRTTTSTRKAPLSIQKAAASQTGSRSSGLPRPAPEPG